MSNNVCVHVNNFKADEGLAIYNTVHSHFIACVTAEYRKRKTVNRICHSCRRRGLRLHACLHCVYFGCHPTHIHEHARINRHHLSVDLVYGNIYCAQCGDYEYDDELSTIARNNLIRVARSAGRPVVSWVPIWPNRPDISELQRHSTRLRLSSQTPVGLRPLINLGQTCYMNCIIQVLMHTPLLRDHLMAGKHLCKNSDGLCVMCEIARLFQEFYCGERDSLAPHRLLHLVWTHARHLAGDKQQDAQEFFLATLDMLHRHCTPQKSEDSNHINDTSHHVNDQDKCQGIIEQIFRGRLQSDVVCQKCKGVSTTIDPFWDISLDLGPAPQGSSLLDCLERFTRAEHLGASAKIMCSSCNSNQESTKQFTIRKLPIVASFHLKRFEHCTQVDKKVSTFISFPEVLDMTPFMSRPKNSTNGSNVQNSIFSAHDNNYVLFAVINHEGSLYCGHYTAFVRLQPNYWYNCDDQKITRATVKDVLSSEGYLLFYHKKTMEYV